VRLVLGTRIGVSDDEPPELPADDPAAAAWEFYDWLTYLQETLVSALW